jgi:uncharacterized protein
MKRLFLAIFVFLSLSFCAFAFEKPIGFLNDYENILSTDEEIEAVLRGFEEETSVEIAVVTVEDFDGMSIEEFAERLFSEWGIGKKDKDNGVLIVVSATQRQSRIEVGYGLESVLTDGYTGRVQDEAMIPYFKDDEFDRGIKQGLTLMMQKITGEDASYFSDTVITESSLDGLEGDTFNFFDKKNFVLWIILGLIECVVLYAGATSNSGPIQIIVLGIFTTVSMCGVYITEFSHLWILTSVGAGLGFVVWGVYKLLVLAGIVKPTLVSSVGGRGASFFSTRSSGSSSSGSSSSFGGFSGGSSGGGGSSRSW